MILYFLIPFTIIISFAYFYNKSKTKKMIYETLFKLSEQNSFSIQKSNNKLYDFILENENNIIYIKYISIPKNSSITINSKTTWCLRYGGGNRAGRAYPNKEYLSDLTNFLKKDFVTDKNVRKIVLVYPSTEKLLKYINESEIITVKQSDIVYGTQIIMFNSIDQFLFESTPHHH